MSTLDFWKYRKPAPAPSSFPGAGKLRIGIVHARWNSEVIDALLSSTLGTIIKAGVKEENIIIQSVPGSWELPFGVASIISAAEVEAENRGSASTEANKPASEETQDEAGEAALPGDKKTPLDAVIGIGVLIKGNTMHFEYIAESVCNGLMRIGLDTKTPVILGLLCCLTEDQALERAGIGRGEFPGHNHGIDWANAALELAIKNKNGYRLGKFHVLE